MLLASLTLALALVPPHAAADCGAKTSCAGCMAEPACVWCPDPALAAKCMPRVTARDTCPGHAVIDVASRVDTLEARPVSPDPGAGGQYVQISPQRVSAQLRPGRPVTLQFEVAHAKQFPIDLYFLMDLSWSMRDSRENLAKLGGDIIDAIKRKTENLATGFGSFVEKNVQPFTSAISSFNCAAEARDCTPPYSFYHRAVLGDLSPAEFSRAVLDSPMAGNIDDPEGSLDALMQVMVCGERIGWRRDSRKIIILSTDRDYHFALDGKLAGIFEPNDGLCHLNSTGGGSGYYTHGELLDYPSVSHINSVAQEHNFLVMFAVIDKYQVSCDWSTPRSSPLIGPGGVHGAGGEDHGVPREPAGGRRLQHHRHRGGAVRGDHDQRQGGGQHPARPQHHLQHRVRGRHRAGTQPLRQHSAR